LTLPSLVDCCFFTPPADGGGRLGASSAPPIQRTRPTPPRRRSKNASRGCGVAATAMEIHVWSRSVAANSDIMLGSILAAM
jgi:hypothetical protein